MQTPTRLRPGQRRRSLYLGYRVPILVKPTEKVALPAQSGITQSGDTFNRLNDNVEK